MTWTLDKQQTQLPMAMVFFTFNDLLFFEILYLAEAWLVAAEEIYQMLLSILRAKCPSFCQCRWCKWGYPGCLMHICRWGCRWWKWGCLKNLCEYLYESSVFRPPSLRLSSTSFVLKDDWWNAIKPHSTIYSNQSIARILDPGNSRENQPDFFSLDHEKRFSISRSRLETQDWKKEILVLVSKHEIERKNFSFSSRKTRFSL